MAHYYQTVHNHPFKWDHVAAAIFQRYPNPFSKHVLSEDTLHREMINKDVLYSRRFIMKTNNLPKWGEKLVYGIKKVPLVEESIVDKKNKTITTYIRNIGLSRFMLAIEKVVYTVNPDDPSETVATKEVWIESGLYGLRSAVKNFGIERFKKNCLKATAGFNHVLEKFNDQQHYFNNMGQKRWQEMKHTKETLKQTAKTAVEIAKSHTTVNAEEKIKT